MSALVVPCLGRKIVNGIPHYLNRHPDGDLLIKYAIDGVFDEEVERLLVVLLSEDALEYEADEKVAKALVDYPVEVVLLDEMTSGPAETVYQTIKKVGIVGRMMVKDSDNHLAPNCLPKGNFVAGLDLNTWERDVHNLKSKSFLMLNEQRYLLDIIEKQIRSDVICAGLYGFNQASDFVTAYEHLDDDSFPIKSLYVSHIISYLIGYSGRVFRFVDAGEYETWGDERLWNDLQRDYAMYFIDLDNILDAEGQLGEGNRSRLKRLQDRGAAFVGYTVADEAYKIKAWKQLQDAGLNFIKIIYDCPYSERKALITSATDLDRKVIEL